MRNPIIQTLVFLALIATPAAQNPKELRLKFAALPVYPAIARAARIQDEVEVQFVVNASGETESVTAISGYRLLRAAAVDNIKTWRFMVPSSDSSTEWKYTTTFKFKFSNDRPYETNRLISHRLCVLPLCGGRHQSAVQKSRTIVRRPTRLNHIVDRR